MAKYHTAIKVRNRRFLLYSCLPLLLGVSGAITSIAVAPTFLASGASDRSLRLHSIYPPPQSVGSQQEMKGQILNTSYVKVTPTVVVWDSQADAAEDFAGDVGEGEDDEAIWDEMADVDTDEESDRKKPRTK